ncbi:MAG TPA: hypothetical protein VN631_07300, partial [Negativicutes bacterium]|nr:hypothetical protein [Negativicutes bacterium]
MNGDDRIVAGEGAINHYWTVCFANDVTRNRLGLKYISQMWDQTPYWYLWFGDLPGVFKLSLLECVEEPAWDWRALFRIKYYPHPEEAAFQGLSVLEQICRMSELFKTKPAEWKEGETGCACHGGIHHHGIRFEDLRDGTGAPLASKAEEIPEDFFLAGQMELRHRTGCCSELSWESQESWRIQMTENYYISDQDGTELKVLRKGDIDRDFSGWVLTDFVARRFALGWQEHHGFQSVVESSEEKNGIDFTSDGKTLNASPSATIRHRLVCQRMQHEN